MREAVEAAIRETCAVRGWMLLALNVRTNHVHLVVVTDVPPERAMTSLKAWATRRLREAGPAHSHYRVWSSHGSTRHLPSEAAVEAAVNYVLFEQGEALS